MSGFVKDEEQDLKWSAKTWSGLTNFIGSSVWTDGTKIYYSNSTVQYVLDKATSTWNVKTWNGLTNFNGQDIWTDETNIYYSSGSKQYILNKSTSTWSTKTWSGLTSFNGDNIWTDGTDVYYSNISDQYVLDKTTSTWSTKTWGGLTSFNGDNIWTDGDSIYYSASSYQYVLDKATSTWSTKTWSGLTNFQGMYIWTDGDSIYYSNGSKQYVLNKSTSTWSAKTWTGLTSFDSQYIWTDRTDTYYSYGSDQYTLPPASKIRKGWIEAVDRSKIYKITEKTAVQAPFNMTESVKIVKFDDKYHAFLLNMSYVPRHYSYDGTQWVEESTIPYQNADQPSIIVYQNKIHFLNYNYHYSWDGTSWTQESNIPFNVTEAFNATVVYNNKIHIVSGNYLYSWDGTSWVQESTLPHSVSYASAVVYQDKIHIMGDYNDPDAHYAWNGTSWDTYPNMPFNNYGGPSCVTGKNVETIDVFYMNKHYEWYGGGWWIDDGDPISTLPYACRYPGIYVEDDKRTVHLICGATTYDESHTDNHYMLNHIDYTWETEIELKELVQPSKVSIYDDIRFGSIMKRIKKAWVGELNGSPKLVLRNVPIIEDPVSFGNNVPNNMINGNFSSYRMAAVSLYDRVHILGGTNNVHYSFKVSYDNDPSSAYIGRPIALDLRKESTLPYQFCGDTAFVLDDEIHIFGSNYHTDLRMNHYVYRNRTWVNVNESQHQSVYPNKSAAVQVENDIYIFYEDQILKYHWNPSNDSGTWTGSGSISGYPIYIDNSVYAGWESAVYDKDNNRIILVYYNNAKTYFYSFDLSYSSSLTTMANNVTLLKTVNNDYFLHPLYLDETVVPNGNKDTLFLLGGSETDNFKNVYTICGSGSSDSWSSDIILPYGFYAGNAVFYNGKIHILGTNEYAISTSEYNYAHYSYDGFSWVSESTLPYEFGYGGGAVVYNNRIYIMGGHNNKRGFYYWDGSSWHSAGSLPYDFERGSAVVYDNKIHLLGGMDSGSSNAYWSTKTWNGITNFTGNYIWTDGTDIYYSGGGSSQYVLDKATSTWSSKYWDGPFSSIDGTNVWTDGTNVYYSSGSKQYVLNKSTSVWSKKTWSGYTRVDGQDIWTDGTNYYYSYNSYQYVLNKSTSTWSAKTWSGLTSFSGDNIWTDGTNIYYSDANISNHYVLNKSTSTWSVKTWSGLTKFAGYQIWTDGTDVYYSSYTDQYVLNKSTSTWSTKTWGGLTNFDGMYIWTDGTDTYYSYYVTGTTKQYVLNKPILNSLKHYYYNGSSWINVSTNLPYSFNDGQAIVASGGINILGGNNNPRGHYSWSGSSWSYQTRLPYDFIGGSAIVFDYSVHIMGGVNINSNTSLNYHYVWGQAGSFWFSRENLPTNVACACAVSMTTPVNRFIAGWTEIDNSNLSSSGLGAFSTITDPGLRNCISWTWGGHYPSGSTISNMQYNPAVTVAHNGRIFMINIDADDTASPVINELKLSRLTYNSAVFDHYNDDVLGKLNINNLAYDNHNLYTYGGSYSYNSPTPRIPLYLYEYDSRRSLFKWQKINITSLDGFSATNLDLDSGKNISVIYNNGPMIFTNASILYNYDDQQMSQDIVLILTINSSGVLKGELFGSIGVSIPVIPNDKLYHINYNYCYGLFAYNNMIYFLGGAYNSSMTNAMKRITKYDPVNKTLKYVGKIWDTPNNSMTSSPIDLPYKQNLPYKLDKFGYGVIGNDLHIVYAQNGTVYHKILDLSTEANYYQFDSKKELPLSEPLRDATPPPSTFCGPCFTSDDFFMAICKDNDQYQIYNLIEYFEHIVYEEIDLDEYDYRCRWEVINDDLEIYSDVGDGYIKHITLNKRNNSSIQNIEILTDDDGIAAQYETKLDEYFN